MKRRVRKTPISEKIKNYPFDLWLWVNEWAMSIYWDDYCSLSFGLGNGLTGLFIILSKLNNYTTITNNSSSIFQTDVYNYDKIKQRALRSVNSSRNEDNIGERSPLYAGLVQFIMVLLFTISVINGVNIFLLSVKEYSLLNSERPNSPSVKETLLNEESNTFSNYLGWIFSIFPKHEESFIDDSTSGTNDNSNIEINLFDKIVYQLIVWNPSKFQLFLFSSFSPINLMIVKFINDLSIWKLFFIIFLFNIQTYWLIDKFLILINDKQILYQEMFSEYNKKYVKPKTDILKRDVGIDASKFNNHHDVIVEQSNPFLQNTKSKVFITHDINGKPTNTLSQNDDSFTDERQKFESEKIKFELEKEKFNQLNNSMLSDVDESWFNSTSTPHKAKIPSLNRSFLDNSLSTISHNLTSNNNPNRSFLDNHNRFSPNRPTSPTRSINQSSPGFRSMSPPKSPPKRPSFGANFPSSPSRSTHSGSRTYRDDVRRDDTMRRFDGRDEGRQDRNDGRGGFGYARPLSPRKNFR